VQQQLVNTASVTVKLLQRADVEAFDNVASDVFDGEVNKALAREFLDDPRHHIAVALEGDLMVGMASAVHYVHPDKPAQLFVNEIAVSQSYQQKGIGSKLLNHLMSRGRELGCTEAWVATEPENTAARALYEKAGGQEDPIPFVMYTFPLGSKPMKVEHSDTIDIRWSRTHRRGGQI
jgi:ribosomal protein S18 acetylase RimI-like enzyme